MTKLTADRVLRALARFESASCADVGAALGRRTPNEQRRVWQYLQSLTVEGFAMREGERGSLRYSISEAGRAELARAA
jgi:hypothetical protein